MSNLYLVPQKYEKLYQTKQIKNIDILRLKTHNWLLSAPAFMVLFHGYSDAGAI